MKVSKRIAELRSVLANVSMYTDGRCAIEYKIIQLEVDVVAMVQEARHEGYKAGKCRMLKGRGVV